MLHLAAPCFKVLHLRWLWLRSPLLPGRTTGMIHKISNPYLSIFVSFASHARTNVYGNVFSNFFSGGLLWPSLTHSDALQSAQRLALHVTLLFLIGVKKNYRRKNFLTRQMPIFREAGQCHLGWASPPCNKSEPTTSVFLARRISEFPCFSEPFFNFLNKITSNDFERKF